MFESSIPPKPISVATDPNPSSRLDSQLPGKPAAVSPPQVKSGWKREFFTAFFTIFLAELGDKTQLATLLMTAESQSPWIVFAGAAAALITTSLLGVLIGRWLANRLPPRLLQTATGASLLVIAILLFWDAVHI